MKIWKIKLHLSPALGVYELRVFFQRSLPPWLRISFPLPGLYICIYFHACIRPSAAICYFLEIKTAEGFATITNTMRILCTNFQTLKLSFLQARGRNFASLQSWQWILKRVLKMVDKLWKSHNGRIFVQNFIKIEILFDLQDKYSKPL